MKTTYIMLPLFLALAALPLGARAADPVGRTPVSSSTTPGNATYLHVIAQPGSYYLPSNIVASAGKSGIAITSADVTLELNGMAVIGDGVSNGVGISVVGAEGPVRIVNGSVRNWKTAGLAASSGALTLESIHAADQGSFGFNLTMYVTATLLNCTAEENANFGFYAASETKTTFENCRAYANRSGFVLGSAVLRGCIADSNREGGFTVFSASTLENCVARRNGTIGVNLTDSTLSHCSVLWNGGHGIYATRSTINTCTINGNKGQGILAYRSHVLNSNVQSSSLNGIQATDTRVVSCTVSSNTMHGIVANGTTLVSGCQVFGHAGSGDIGIFVINSANRIEDNNVTGNSSGIIVTGQGNFIARNSARNTGANYWIATGNRAGTIVMPTANAAVISGSSSGPGSGTSDPWSNVSY